MGMYLEPLQARNVANWLRDMDKKSHCHPVHDVHRASVALLTYNKLSGGHWTFSK